MSREYTLLSSRNSTRKSRFACTSRSYKYRSCESNLINLRNLSTLRLSCSDILNTIQFSFNHLCLLVLDYLSLNHLLYLRIIQATETNTINLIKYYNQKVIVVTTLIHRRHRTLFSLKNPLESLTSRMNVCYIVSSCCNILQILNLITALCSILHNLISSLVGADKT